MLPALLLQASWPALHPLVTGLILAGVGVLVAGGWRAWDAYLAGRKAKAQAEADWRQARLAAEQALRDALKQETAARTQWQLENDSDLARIADILQDVNETQKLTATLAADSKHHGGELLRINDRVEGIGKQLNDFIMSHVKH